MSETRNEISGVYEELKGILDSLKDSTSWFDDEGFTEQTNSVINRASIICPEILDMRSYLLVKDYIPNRGAIVHTTQTKAKISALIGRLKGTYNIAEKKPASSGHTFIQNQSQTQSQYLSAILDIHERIVSESPKYKVGTKERNFLDKLKDALPTIKSITEILSSALRIGAELGLDPATIHKLLNL